MAPSAAIQDKVSTRRQKLGAGTVPAEGVPPPAPRKRPQSVRVDGSLWAREAPESRTGNHTHGWPYLAQMVLPRPVVAGSRWTLLTSVFMDFLLVFANFVLISHIHAAIHRNLLWLERPPDIPPFRLGFVLLYGSLVTLLANSEGLYRDGINRIDKIALLRAVGWATLLSAVLIHLFGIKIVIPMAPVSATAASSFACMVAWRSWQRQRAAKRAQEGPASRNVLIVGAGKLGHKIAEYLERNPHMGRVVRGYLDDNRGLDSDVLGTVDELARIARAEFADEVILAGSPEAALARRVIQEARRIHLDVKFVPEPFGFEPRSPIPENFGELPVLTLYEEPVPAAGLFLKRGFDLACSSLALLLIAPGLAMIALLIRLESPGPVLYRAPRAGRKGRCFLCYKFRTMVSNADSSKEQLRAHNQREGPFFKIASDPRITRVGRFLRRYSLDELPQLLNVLKGEMSMVGPRPHPLDDFARYELDHLKRLVVTPGITGLWQVTARQDPSFARNLALDQQYIEQWSLRMDLRILWKTLSAVLHGSGA